MVEILPMMLRRKIFCRPQPLWGANTAGCLVNGKVLIPKNGNQSIGGQPLYGLTINAIDTNYYINIKNYSTNQRVYFYMYNVTASGDFIVNQSGGYGSPTTQITQMYLEFDGKIFLSSDNCGIITINRFDYPYFSGTFTATLYNKEQPTEKIQITDGRFDINRLTLNK